MKITIHDAQGRLELLQLTVARVGLSPQLDREGAILQFDILETEDIHLPSNECTRRSIGWLLSPESVGVLAECLRQYLAGETPNVPV